MLIWHAGVADAETGGEYTLKVYSSEKTTSDNDEWQHERITLKPLNPEYQPLILEPEEEGMVIDVAEFLKVL